MRLEVKVQELSTELQVLRQLFDEFPGKVAAIIKAELAQALMAQNESLNSKLEIWRKENDAKLKENSDKIDMLRRDMLTKHEENGNKIDELRRDMDKKFVWLIGLLVAMFIGLYFQ